VGAVVVGGGARRIVEEPRMTCHGEPVASRTAHARFVAPLPSRRYLRARSNRPRALRGRSVVGCVVARCYCRGMVRSLAFACLLVSAGCGRRGEIPPVVAPTGTLARPVAAPVVSAAPAVGMPPIARPAIPPPAPTPAAPEPETTGRVLFSTRPASNCIVSNGVHLTTPRLLMLPPGVYQIVCENEATGQRREFQGITVRAGETTDLRNQSLDAPGRRTSTAPERPGHRSMPPYIVCVNACDRPVHLCEAAHPRCRGYLDMGEVGQRVRTIPECREACGPMFHECMVACERDHPLVVGDAGL